MIVCQKCGDQGFPELLARCDSCDTAALHQYCLDIVGVVFDGRNVQWTCEDCLHLSRSPGLNVKMEAVDHPNPRTKPRNFENCLQCGENCGKSKCLANNGQSNGAKATSCNDHVRPSDPTNLAQRTKGTDQQSQHKHEDVNKLKQNRSNILHVVVPSAAGRENETCSSSLPSNGNAADTNGKRRRKLILPDSDDEDPENGGMGPTAATESIEGVCNGVGINHSAGKAGFRVEKDSALPLLVDKQMPVKVSALPLWHPFQHTTKGNPLDRNGKGSDVTGNLLANAVDTNAKRTRKLILSYSDDEDSEDTGADPVVATESIQGVCNGVGVNHSAGEAGFRVEKDSALPFLGDKRSSVKDSALPLWHPLQNSTKENPLDRNGKGSDVNVQLGPACRKSISTTMDSKSTEQFGRPNGIASVQLVQQGNVVACPQKYKGQVMYTHDNSSEIADRQCRNGCLRSEQTKRTYAVPSSCGLEGKSQHNFDQAGVTDVQIKHAMECERHDMVKPKRSTDQARLSHFSSGSPVANIIPVQPTTPNIWRGCFLVDNKEFGPVDAHLSTRACRRVWDISEALLPILHLDKLSRSIAWRKPFDTTAPSVEDIGLFFFPSELRPNHDLEELLHQVIDEDLVLCFRFDEYELLIFPSTHLPEDYRRFLGRTYLYGTFSDPRMLHRISDKDCRVSTCKEAEA